MPTIEIRDITLLSRLNRYKQNPADAAYDDALYVLLKKAEAAGKPKLSGLDDLPRLVLEEIRNALDGKLVEALKSALLPAIGNVALEVPVELSVKVRLRLEPVLELSPQEPPNKRDDSTARTNGRSARTVELDKLEQQVVEYLRRQGGCWEGSPRALLRALGMAVDESLVRRLYKHLHVKGGRTCLPEAVAKEDDVVIAE